MLDSEITTPERERERDPGQEEARPPAGRRRVLWVVLGATVVLGLGAAGTLYATRDDTGSADDESSSLPTATVTRTDMTDTTDVDGTLGYQGSLTVLGPGSGRVTWLPATGAVITRGERAYGVDGHVVPLFYGSTPFWRELTSGVSKGYDVLELERNLKALGYGDDLAVDRTFTWATEAAVKKWQKAAGLPRTGKVKPDDVVVQPGAIRVTKVEVVLGGPAAGVVLTASTTARRITVELPVSDQDIARKGAKVQVTLPGGRTATGHISSIGTVATAAAAGSSTQTGESTENATVPVYVTLDKAADAGTLDTAPATVGFTSTEHKNVLAVPVNALLASSDASYTVNTVDAAGKVRAVPVKLGIFEGDDVEVKGDLTAGTKVQVPGS